MGARLGLGTRIAIGLAGSAAALLVVVIAWLAVASSVPFLAGGGPARIAAVFARPETLGHIGSTLATFLPALLVGCMVGLPLGAVLGGSEVARTAVQPLLNILGNPPFLVALLPLTVVLFGFDKLPLAVAAGLAACFVGMSGAAWATARGLDHVRALAALTPQPQVQLRQPSSAGAGIRWAMPDIFMSARRAAQICLVVTLAGEMFSGRSGVMAGLIVQGSATFDTDAVLAGIILIGLLAFAVEGVLAIPQAILRMGTAAPAFAPLAPPQATWPPQQPPAAIPPLR